MCACLKKTCRACLLAAGDRPPRERPPFSRACFPWILEHSVKDYHNIFCFATIAISDRRSPPPKRFTVRAYRYSYTRIREKPFDSGNICFMFCFRPLRVFVRIQNKLELHAPYNLWDCARVLSAAEMYQTQNFIDVAIPPAAYTAAPTG